MSTGNDPAIPRSTPGPHDAAGAAQTAEARIDALAHRLQPGYSRFDVARRLLFTGHSHQAWPDAAFDAVREYEEMVCREVDGKWLHAFERTELLRGYLRSFYDDPDGAYCCGLNTHMLLVSWLSCLDLRSRPRILSTDGEFHSLHRQLAALEPHGVQVEWLPHADPDQLAEHVERSLGPDVSAVMVSRVFFETARVNTALERIALAANAHGVPLLVDDYHGTNVVPLSLRGGALEQAYVLIGGYKYLQWGEGNCFLRFPRSSGLWPVVTGWFASFGTLDRPRGREAVAFDPGDQRFATGTYDPVSQYRASGTVRFFERNGLTPTILQTQYQLQTALLRRLFLARDPDPAQIRLAVESPQVPLGGFVAFRSPGAREISAALRRRGVYTDARGEILRAGPAPYTTSSQCREFIDVLVEATESVFGV